MNIKSEITVLDSIEQIGTSIKTADELNESFASKLELLKGDLLPLTDYLDCNETQAILFGVIFYLNITDGPCSINEIARTLKCSPFEMIRLDPELQEMVKNKQITKGNLANRRRRDLNYCIPTDLVELITKNLKPAPVDTNLDLYDVAELLTIKLNEFRENEISTDILCDEIKFYIEKFPHLGVFKFLKSLHLNASDQIIFIYIFTDICIGAESVDIQWGLNSYISKIRERLEMRRMLLTRKAKLIESETIEFIDDHYRSDRSVRFTTKAMEAIFGEELMVSEKKRFNPGSSVLIEYTSIQEKELYYEKDELKELKMFEDVLESNKYKSVVAKLKDKKLASGITAILHGYPGTGKTESVYQLARKSKRNILMVDISQIRDKYVGESEKQLKEIFNVYRKALKYFDEAPILLFNESDSLISKRVNVSQSTDQMNNTMQNILLQELENFEGIFMATTNLVNNMDSAFERRFLFKVKFSKPGANARAMIWKSKVETLTKKEALQLGTDYEFSGGQIDNITKKMLMSSLLNDKPCKINDVIEYCNNELFMKKDEKKRIGFK